MGVTLGASSMASLHVTLTRTRSLAKTGTAAREGSAVWGLGHDHPNQADKLPGRRSNKTQRDDLLGPQLQIDARPPQRLRRPERVPFKIDPLRRRRPPGLNIGFVQVDERLPPARCWD